MRCWRPAGAAVVACALLPCHAHRLDEYLQAALITLQKDRVQLEISLTPGVAVLPAVLLALDADRDGTLSEAEQRAYAQQVMGDLSLSLDGRPEPLQLVSAVYPSIDEMREGLGTIRLKLTAMVPSGGPDRKLVFQNRHRTEIAAYLVNCLVPRDPSLRLNGQHRSYDQSLFRLEYVQSSASQSSLWFSAAGLLLLVRLAWHRRALGGRSPQATEPQP